MIKKIGIRDLRPGMFVHDLNCSWTAHPLFSTRFKVRSIDEIEKMIELGLSTLYIDTSMGDDAPNAATLDEVRGSIESALLKMAETQSPQGESRIGSEGDELNAAMKIHREAHQTVQGLMSHIRLGRQTELEKMEPQTQGIVDSIFRNSGTLIQLFGIRTKDQYTFSHSVSVCTLLTAFARTLNLGHDITRKIAIGGMLHDIGKMRVPDAILNKPARLSEEEFSQMKLHVDHGLEILSDISWFSPISMQVAAQHHERFDGSGYPAGLKGNRISQFGQMAAIVDVYDAITSDRVYHQAMEPVEAIRKIQEWSEHHFNQELVGHFIRSVGIFPLGTLVRLESSLLGVVVEHSGADLLRPVVRIFYDALKQWRVPPYNLDLSLQSADRIVGYEPAEKWGIVPSDFFPYRAGGELA